MTEAIYSILSANAGVTALIVQRMYPNIVPMATEGEVSYPCVMFEQISGFAVNSQQGRSTYHEGRVEVHSYSTEKQAALTLRRAVNAALERKAPGNYGSVVIMGITLIDEDEDYFFDANGDGIYECTSEFSVVYG